MEGYPATVQPNPKRSNVVFGDKICNFYHLPCASFHVSRIDAKRPSTQKVYPYYHHIIHKLSTQPFPAPTSHTSLLSLLHRAVYKSDKSSKTVREVFSIIEEALGPLSREDEHAVNEQAKLYSRTLSRQAGADGRSPLTPSQSRINRSSLEKRLRATKRIVNTPTPKRQPTSSSFAPPRIPMRPQRTSRTIKR